MNRKYGSNRQQAARAHEAQTCVNERKGDACPHSAPVWAPHAASARTRSKSAARGEEGGWIVLFPSRTKSVLRYHPEGCPLKVTKGRVLEPRASQLDTLSSPYLIWLRVLIWINSLYRGQPSDGRRTENRRRSKVQYVPTVLSFPLSPGKTRFFPLALSTQIPY